MKIKLIITLLNEKKKGLSFVNKVLKNCFTIIQ